MLLCLFLLYLKKHLHFESVKNLFTFFLLLLSSVFSYAQSVDLECDFPNAPTQLVSSLYRSPLSIYSCSMSVHYIRQKLETSGGDFSQEVPYVINVKFHIVSQLANQVTECDVLERVRFMNEIFNPFKIFFNYTGFDIYQAPLEDINNLHIIIVPYGNNFISDSFSNKVTISLDAFTNTPITLIHEVGHALSLYHISAGSNGNSGVTSVPVQVSSPFNCNGNLITEVQRPDWTNYTPGVYITEHVTRDSSDPDFNAYLAGDCIPDTDAFTINLPSCMNSYGLLEHIGFDEVVDIIGTPYDVGLLTMNNIMGGRQYKYFTPGQGWRMRSYIEDCIQRNIKIANALTNHIKPYYVNIETDTDNNHIISIEQDPNNPGYAIVCRPQNLVHKFQPGFEYHIYQVHDGNYINGDIVDTNDVTLFQIIPANFPCEIEVTGVLLAVKIPEISNDIIMFEDIACIRSMACNSEQITSTTVYSTKNLGSNNGTISVFNTRESADPNLENRLESQMFHEIIKETTTGAKKEKIIYKQ